MQRNELAREIKISIEDSSVPLWFPNLTIYLAEMGWQTLNNEYGLAPANYGTARIMSGRVNYPLFILPPEGKSNFDPLRIELLSKEIADNYLNSGISFYTAEELSSQPILDCVLEAIEVIKITTGLHKSVSTLIKSLHLIKLEDDDYDVSFSEPALPFSIFVSVPKKRIKADFLRVAEAIVHEAMHLQLSLIEKVIPLIDSDEQKFYSPWKDEYRNATGILHALYVFRVIESFYEQLELKQYLSPPDLNFIKTRRSEISRQISEMKEFSRSSDLTASGLRLAKRLLN